MTEIEMNNFLKTVRNDLMDAYDNGIKTGAEMIIGAIEGVVMNATSLDDVIAFIDDFKRRNALNGGSEEENSI